MIDGQNVPVPHRLDGAVLRFPLMEIAAERALIRFPGVGRMLVDRDGGEQRQPDPGRLASDFDFLADSAHALTALLDSRLALRAAVVSVDGGGVAFCGLGSTGKSTLAAAFAVRGYPHVTDSVAEVATGPDVPPHVVPRAGGALLWPDAAERLWLDADAGARVRDGIAVRRFGVEAGIIPAVDPVPLVAVVFLAGDPGDVYAVDRLHGFDAVNRLQRARWHGFATTSLGLDACVFTWSTQIARAVDVIQLVTPRRLPDLGRVVDLVLESIAGGVP